MADSRDSKDQAVTITTPRRRAGDLNLPEGVSQQIIELANRFKARPGTMARPDPGRSAKQRGAMMAILSGASNVDRAAAAEAIAAQAGLALLTLDLSQAVSK